MCLSACLFQATFDECLCQSLSVGLELRCDAGLNRLPFYSFRYLKEVLEGELSLVKINLFALSERLVKHQILRILIKKWSSFRFKVSFVEHHLKIHFELNH